MAKIALVAYSAILVLCVTGINIGIFIRRIPIRGWIAVLLLFFSALFWMLNMVAMANDSSTVKQPWTLAGFSFFASFAIIYSFRAFRNAPDRLLARASFFASFIIAVALLFVLFGAIYAIALFLSHPDMLNPQNY